MVPELGAELARRNGDVFPALLLQLHLTRRAQVIVLLKALCGGSNTDIDQSRGSAGGKVSGGGRTAPTIVGFFDQFTQREAILGATLLFVALM